jgi:uncharacterized protein YrzB (UPF0473 family)
MEEQIFILNNAEGEPQRCRVIFNFETDDHSYVLFTLIDDVGHATSDITALRYELDDNGEMTNFADLESDEEWDMVQEVLNTITDEFSQDQSRYFAITGEDGEEIVCVVLHKFELPQFGKNYLFYAYEKEEGVYDEVFASAYIADEQGNVADLEPIETDEEWAAVEFVLNSLQN